MIVKLNSLDGAKPELKAQIEALAKAIEPSGWDLYPVKIISETEFHAMPYTQLHTVWGRWESLKGLIPKTLSYDGDGNFSLSKAAQKS